MTQVEIIETAESEFEDELSALLLKIADDLSTLSDATEVPRGYKASNDPFPAENVRFDSSVWLARVIQVQAWLHLDDEIPPSALDSDPLKAALALFKQLGVEDFDACVDQSDSTIALSYTGAESLSTRLDTATRLEAQYTAAREDQSRHAASEAWNEAWDEEQPAETLDEPIRAQTKTWYISQFAAHAEKGKLNLKPSYQRGDVWPTADSQKLVESILRGIPLPSIIVLKPKGHGSQASYEVVDGKQRLTAILRFIGRHPEAIAHAERAKEIAAQKGSDIDFPKLLRENYKKFRRLWKTHMGEQLSGTLEAKYYFPFKLNSKSAALRGPLESLAGKYYCDIREEEVAVGEGHSEVGDVFESQVSAYQLPLIEYLEATPRQIHEVFNLYNRQGKKLTAEEIRNALYHEVTLARVLLVAAGDFPFNPDMLQLPGLEEQKFDEISTYLTDHGFGISRYKRTKVLSWLTAILLQPAISDGELTIRSTAKQIDELFHNVAESSGSHSLANGPALRTLVSDLHRCLESHAAFDGWPARFKDNKDGVKWQELQLVASLIGVFMLGLTDEPIDALEAHTDAIREFCAAHPRPAKTQNRTQWAYIGQVSLGLIELLGVGKAQVGAEMTRRYEANCVPTLEAARWHHTPEGRGG